jgi:CheY-like chemotaxis protein
MGDIAAGLLDGCQLPLMAKDGTLVPVETRVTRGLWGDHQVLFGISRDISERLRSQEVLRQLAAGVAHNFNNLLAAILGNAQAAEGLLKRIGRDDADPERLRQLLDNVVYGALSGRGVVKRLAAYVGGQTPGDQPPGTCEVEEVVRAALEIAQTAFRSSTSENILFETELETGLRARVPRDELMEVCLNLIRNAMEAMDHGGVLAVRSGQDKGQAFLSLGDTGPGMDQQTLQRVFEPFFTTKGVRGQGLGLPSSRGMIRSHGGDIEVASAPGQGARFTVWLGPWQDLPSPEEAAPGADRPPSGLKVLLVEDEALVAMGLRALLEEEGLEVVMASRVSEAARALEEASPQAVLCDLGLPDGSGWDVARLLAKHAQAQGQTPPPLILLTGWTSEPLPFEHPQDVPSAWGVLHKPVEKDLLLKTLGQATHGLA